MTVYDRWYEGQTDEVLKLFDGSEPETANEAAPAPAVQHKKTHKVMKTCSRIMDALRGAALMGLVAGMAQQDWTSIVCFVVALLISLVWRCDDNG